MKLVKLFFIMLTVPFFAMAQKNETVKANQQTKAAREGDVFIFPDNIRFYKNELNERVEQKTMELTRYIKALAQNDGTNHADEIEAAMRLFNNNEYAMVTVTRKSQPDPVTVPVRTYLNRLVRLKYNTVNITWRNAQYVSNFTKQPDGTYMGLVAFEQEFTGVKGGESNYTYNDVTQKRAEVTVKVWDSKETPRKEYMTVFLGNIGVTEE